MQARRTPLAVAALLAAALSFGCTADKLTRPTPGAASTDVSTMNLQPPPDDGSPGGGPTDPYTPEEQEADKDTVKTWDGERVVMEPDMEDELGASSTGTNTPTLGGGGRRRAIGPSPTRPGSGGDIGTANYPVPECDPTNVVGDEQAYTECVQKCLDWKFSFWEYQDSFTEAYADFWEDLGQPWRWPLIGGHKEKMRNAVQGMRYYHQRFVVNGCKQLLK